MTSPEFELCYDHLAAALLVDYTTLAQQNIKARWFKIFEDIDIDIFRQACENLQNEWGADRGRFPKVADLWKYIGEFQGQMNAESECIYCHRGLVEVFLLNDDTGRYDVKMCRCDSCIQGERFKKWSLPTVEQAKAKYGDRILEDIETMLRHNNIVAYEQGPKWSFYAETKGMINGSGKAE